VSMKVMWAPNTRSRRRFPCTSEPGVPRRTAWTSRPSLAAAAQLMRTMFDCAAALITMASAFWARASAMRNSSLRGLLPPRRRPVRTWLDVLDERARHGPWDRRGAVVVLDHDVSRAEQDAGAADGQVFVHAEPGAAAADGAGREDGVSVLPHPGRVADGHVRE